MKVYYFASLRESLKIADEEIQATSNMTIGDLRTLLANKHGKQHFTKNILCALNQELTNNAATINNTDEIAFYPPVTGG